MNAASFLLGSVAIERRRSSTCSFSFTAYYLSSVRCDRYDIGVVCIAPQERSIGYISMIEGEDSLELSADWIMHYPGA